MTHTPLSAPVTREVAERFLRHAYPSHFETQNGVTVFRDGHGDAVELSTLKTRAELLDLMMRTEREHRPALLGLTPDESARQQTLTANLFYNDHFALGAAGQAAFAFAAALNENRSEVSAALQQQYWTAGKPFTLPAVWLPRGVGAAYTVADLPHALTAVAGRFRDADGRVLFPVHPALGDAYAAHAAAPGFARVLPDASVRTFQLAPEPGELPLKLKLHLPLFHHTAVRRISKTDGRHCVHMTAELLRAIDTDPELGRVLAILPEPVALINEKDDSDPSGTSAAVVRVATPYPPHPSGKRTFALPVFALGQTDLRDGRNTLPRMSPLAGPHDPSATPLGRFLRNRQTSASDAATFYFDTIERPYIEANLRLILKHGLCHGMPHSQNTLVEVDEDGQLTGRIVFTDLHDVMELSRYRRKLWIPTVQDQYHQRAFPQELLDAGISEERAAAEVIGKYCQPLIEELRGAAIAGGEIHYRDVAAKASALQSDLQASLGTRHLRVPCI